nr:caspase family protein [Plastoroseomonas hellenica]
MPRDGPTVSRAFACLLLLLAALAVGPAEARRVALVVGIDNYQQVEKLSRARNDATAVAARLTIAGFEVILRTDPDRRALSVALSEFEERLRGAEVGMFFFAGHGVEIRGTNVLLPADIPSTLSETIILREGLLLTDLAQAMSDSGVRYSALIIDACRDNPLPRQAGRSTGRTRGLGRADAPRGTYVVYSAGIGEAALDRLSDADTSPNSVFTRHLLPALAEPGVSLDAAVKQVRERVRTDAAMVRHAQNPAIYDQATGELFLIPSAPRPEAPPAGTAPSVALPPPPGGADATELLFWQSVQLQGQAPELEAYLARWPDGIFAPIARARLAALAAPAPPPRSLPASAPAPLGRDGVQQLQRGLAGLGLDPGPADGTAGPRTTAAIRAFQAATGLPVDGEATEPVLQRLRDGPAPGSGELARGLAAQVPSLLEVRNAAEAVRVLELGTRLAPQETPLWLMLGDAQRDRGANDAARRAFSQAQRAGAGTPVAEEAQRRLAALPAVTPVAAGTQPGAPAPPGRCGVSFAGVRSQDGLTGFAFRNSCATPMAFRAECPGAPALARGDLTVGANSGTVVWAPARGAVQACRVTSSRAR